jgi:DNA-binding MarR family transcriptional regulator
MDHLDIVGLLKAAQVLERNMTVALMYSGLRIPQYRLLDALARAGQSTVTELSEALRVTRATASVTVNELLRAGALAAVENASDRRSFHVRLTAVGEHKLGVARSDIAVFRARLSERYGAVAIAALNDFAARAIDHQA